MINIIHNMRLNKPVRLYDCERDAMQYLKIIPENTGDNLPSEVIKILSAAKNLKTLHLTDLTMTDDTSYLLSKMRNIRCLILDNTPLSPAQTKEIAQNACIKNIIYHDKSGRPHLIKTTHRTSALEPENKVLSSHPSRAMQFPQKINQ